MIPQLKLMALLVGVRLAKYINRIFKFSIVIIWGDSKAAIARVDRYALPYRSVDSSYSTVCMLQPKKIQQMFCPAGQTFK